MKRGSTQWSIKVLVSPPSTGQIRRHNWQNRTKDYSSANKRKEIKGKRGRENERKNERKKEKEKRKRKKGRKKERKNLMLINLSVILQVKL